MQIFFLACTLQVYLCKDVKADEMSNVLSPVEAYLNSILPNTSMPEVIHDLIYPGSVLLFFFIINIKTISIYFHSYYGHVLFSLSKKLLSLLGPSYSLIIKPQYFFITYKYMEQS